MMTVIALVAAISSVTCGLKKHPCTTVPTAEMLREHFVKEGQQCFEIGRLAILAEQTIEFGHLTKEEKAGVTETIKNAKETCFVK